MHSPDQVLVSETWFQTHSQSVSMLKSAPEKCVFTNHVPLAVSESEFDPVIRILRLKSSCASLYSVKVIKMSRLASDRFTGHFLIAKQTAQLFCP